MYLQRQSTIAEAMRAQRAKRQEAEGKRRKRKSKEKPWQVLKEDWFRFVRARYGRVIQLSPWGPKEAQLARALLKEVELETATRMAELFVERWSGDGLPSFGYFWTARDSYQALAEGRIEPRSTGLTRGEYDENTDGQGPAHGW